MTISACGGSACISGVSRDCGHGIFRLEVGATRSQTRRDTNFAIPGYSISAMIPRRGVKIKFFLSVVIYVVKGDFVPLSATDGNPANAGIARLCGVSPHPIPDAATALPNQARYQLRYTWIFNFCHYTTAGEKIKDFSVCGHLCGQSRFCAVFSNRDKSRKRRASFTKPCYYTACSARLQGLFVVCGPFFRIFGANALHGLVLLTYLIV